MRRAIVTGATGFIGSWLTEELLENGYQVTAIVRDRRKLLPQIAEHPACKVVCRDLKYLSAEDLDETDYDVFYHLGWAGVSTEQKNDARMQISNIAITMNALEVARKRNCSLFLATGTVAEYALTRDVLDVSAKQTPNDMYGAAKVATHYFLEVQARKLGQPSIWAVLPSTFGERRTDNNIITYTIRSLLKGERPQFGRLEQMWDFLYVSEVVRALRLTGEKGIPGTVYGIGSGEYKPLKEYIMCIRDLIDPALELGIGDKPSLSEQTFSSCVNISELTRDTGFIPRISFREGIERTISFWREYENEKH